MYNNIIVAMWQPMCCAMYISHYTDLINLIKLQLFILLSLYSCLLLEFQGGAEIKAWLLFATSAAAINISFLLSLSDSNGFKSVTLLIR